MPVTAYKLFTVAANNSAVGAVAWSDPDNAKADDTNAATSALGASPNDTTQRLVLTDADFSAIPDSATINGIEVRIRRRQSATNVRDLSLTIWQGGASVGNNKADTLTNWTASAVTITYGGSIDTWGLTLTGADVKAAGFGIQFRAQRNSGTPTASVELGDMRIWYTEAQAITKGNLFVLEGSPPAAEAIAKGNLFVLEGSPPTAQAIAKANLWLVMEEGEDPAPSARPRVAWIM